MSADDLDQQWRNAIDRDDERDARREKRVAVKLATPRYRIAQDPDGRWIIINARDPGLAWAHGRAAPGCAGMPRRRAAVDRRRIARQAMMVFPIDA